MRKTTDNHNLRAKLDLRRYFLRKYHADDPPNVLDCCQGSGLLWSRLRTEFKLAGYWGIDLKPKKGRVAVASERVLSQPGWPQNVVDIDTYGSPWKHWLAMLPNITRPVTVFLTIGQVCKGFARQPQVVFDAVGCRMQRLNASSDFLSTIQIKLAKIALSYLLATGCDSVKIIEAVEAVSGGNARYIGIRVEPIKSAGTEGGTSGRPKRKQAEKEPAHV